MSSLWPWVIGGGAAALVLLEMSKPKAAGPADGGGGTVIPTGAGASPASAPVGTLVIPGTTTPTPLQLAAQISILLSPGVQAPAGLYGHLAALARGPSGQENPNIVQHLRVLEQMALRRPSPIIPAAPGTVSPNTPVVRPPLVNV
jgi:hypothetical protein